MNLWDQYFNELWNRETLQSEHGFVAYEVIKDQCFIHDLFVVPERRKTLEAIRLINDVVLKTKCHSLAGSVHIQSKGAAYAVAVNLKYGMNIVKADGDRIYFYKEVLHG